MSKLYISTVEGRAFWGGIDVGLTAGEFRTLAKLATKPGSYFSYRDIYDAIQSPGFVAGEGCEGYKVNVRSMIKRIRFKFMKLDPAWYGIQNYMAFGYYLKQEVMQQPVCCPTCGQIVISMSDLTIRETVMPIEYDWSGLLDG